MSNRAIAKDLNISEYKVRSILKNSAMKNALHIVVCYLSNTIPFNFINK